MPTVLIAEDDEDIRELLSLYLGGDGFDLLVACNGREALEILESETIDIMLVDIMMPLMNGIDFIKNARKVSAAPIIVISARTQTADKALVLGIGADGYITKPFDPLEAMALVKALIRRCQAMPSLTEKKDDSLIVVGPLELDLDALVLRKNGDEIPLTAAELKIMMKLMRNPGRVFTKTQLYEAICGSPCIGGEESVMVHISNIRSKVELCNDEPVRISTIRGLGYRLDA